MTIKSIAKSLGLGRIPLVRFFYNNIVKMRVPNKDSIVPCLDFQILVRNPRKSLIGKSIYVHKVWEREVTEFISLKIEPGMTILDIGADIGYYTLLFAKLVGPQGSIFSFEPIPTAKWYLDKNIEINKLTNVTSFGFALFDKQGKVCLEDPFTKSKINLTKKILSGNDIEVEMKVFDECRAEIGINHIDLMKIDVEGAECNILRGMESTLREQHPAILIEVHSQHLKSFHFSPTDIIAFLSALDYKIESVDKPEIDFSQGNITLFCR